MNLNNILKKIFTPGYYWLLIFLALIETASYFGFIFWDLDHWFFVLISLLVLIISLKNIRYGVYAAILELLIGSKGYLLHLDISGGTISIRIAIWAIILGVWLKYFIYSLRQKDQTKRSVFLKKEILTRGYFKLFLILFVMIAWGAVNGFLRNSFDNAFLDFNGWLYFAIIFPVYEAIFNKNLQPEGESNPFWPIWRVFAVGISWAAIKTYTTLFVFSHIPGNANPLRDFFTHQMYYWIRNTGVGEITNMPSGFVRVFFQSHIFLLPALFLLLLAIGRYWGEIIKSRKLIAFSIFWLSIISSLLVISFSRSFWVGLATGLLLYGFLAWKRFGLRRLAITCALLIGCSAIGLGIMTVTIKFPYPKTSTNFNVADALADRAKNVSSEAAVSSRSALWPKLWEGIYHDPILGSGFGKTISYKTSDPRAISTSANGIYTTYAFEWGWLDVWIKLGIFGILAYIYILFRIFKDCLEKETFVCDLMSIVIIVFAAVNFFTPYSNHPLGIGLLLVAAAAVSWEKKPCPCA